MKIEGISSLQEGEKRHDDDKPHTPGGGGRTSSSEDKISTTDPPCVDTGDLTISEVKIEEKGSLQEDEERRNDDKTHIPGGGRGTSSGEDKISTADPDSFGSSTTKPDLYAKIVALLKEYRRDFARAGKYFRCFSGKCCYRKSYKKCRDLLADHVFFATTGDTLPSNYHERSSRFLKENAGNLRQIKTRDVALHIVAENLLEFANRNEDEPLQNRTTYIGRSKTSTPPSGAVEGEALIKIQNQVEIKVKRKSTRRNFQELLCGCCC